MKLTITLMVFLSFTAFNFVHAQETETKIYGKVKGKDNTPLNGANVVIEGSIDGATTDSTGHFDFETSKSGKVELLFTAIDYNEKRQEVIVDPGKPVEINIQLHKSEVQTEEIIVTASSYTSGEQSSVTITPLEIVRIPGSDADLYRALSTFPGSNQVDEGSRISVRGGDPDEVLTILDQASLYHPFIFDDDFNTSSFTTINPWGLRGINFSSGGFSAKFGNTLSAVLDLKSYDMPQGTGGFAWLGLANASLAGVYVNKKKNFGATFGWGQTFLEPYFRINGFLIDTYNPIPSATGFGGTLSYNPNSKSNIKGYFDYSADNIGIRNTSPSYDGFFNSKTRTYFGNIKYSTGIGAKTFLGAGLSYSFHKDDASYGVFNNITKETYTKFRLDITHELSDKLELNTGAEYEYNEDGFSGTVPILSYDLALNAPSFSLSTKGHTGRIGAYAEIQWKPVKRFFAILGLRTDYHTLSKKQIADPRFSTGYKIAKDHTIRGAIGLYHQFAALQYYPETLNNYLKPEQATHYILGYEFNHDNGNYMFRVEGYYKDYRDLVLVDPNNSYYYGSGGKGIAKGVDVFLKTKIKNKFTGWISYAYTDSKRSQYGTLNQEPAKYDITHNFTLVGTYNITDNLTTGFTFRTSTGKPYTPVMGATFDSTFNVYAPLYGEPNSGRFPTYRRFDVNLQYIFSLFGRFAIAVFQVNNVFNQRNLYDYTYNRDYTQRVEIVTSNKRQFYFGLGLQF
jgi:vitamin B12 transporter